MSKSNPIYAFKVQEEEILDRLIDVTKERDMLKHKLDELMDKNLCNGVFDQSHISYTQVNKEMNGLKEKVEHLTQELQITISLMRTYPTSDINAHRLFLKYMEDILKIAM